MQKLHLVRLQIIPLYYIKHYASFPYCEVAIFSFEQ